MIVTHFMPIDPLGLCTHCDSRVIHSERVELTRYQIAATNRPGYFDDLVQIDHLSEVPILTRFHLSEHSTVILPHIDTLFTTSTPKVMSPIEGWHPGDAVMEPIIHRWDPMLPTEWNQLLRATSNVNVKGFGVLTITATVDVNYYRAKFIQQLHFKDGQMIPNIGYVTSSSIGPIVFEMTEI